MPSRVLHYFAYGSNLYPERLRRRCPSVRPIGTLRLDGWRLAFHKRSEVDGSGKCNLVDTSDPADVVHGAVYTLDPAEKPDLDAAEGLGVSYREHRVRTEAYGEVFFYLAEPAFIVDGMVPNTWYHRYVLEGARLHGLPDDYFAAIAALPTQPDPDPERNRRHDEAFAAGKLG